MANNDIRRVIISNMADKTKEEIKRFIQDAIDEQEEQALPGMGILFEAMWKKRDDKEKNKLMDWITDSIN